MQLAEKVWNTTRGELVEFVRESNRIEGILRDPTPDEVEAHERFLRLFQVHATTLGDLQAVLAPGMPLREREGMNVRVGSHIAPEGGPNILRRLQALLRKANGNADPWELHCAYETLHPYMDGNGRTGRALWVWMMMGQGRDPFALPFLHRWYYQTLERVGR